MKPSGKPSGRTPVPQPHGGALVPGAGGGPQPGSGRPPSAIRRTLRESFEERVNILGKITDNGDEMAADRIRAIDLLLKYGLGGEKGWSHERAWPWRSAIPPRTAGSKPGL
jgi:hypothetical protein